MRPSTRWPPISRAWSSLLPLALLLAPAPLLAHGPVPTGPDDLWSHWSTRPQIALPLLLAGVLYARGLQRAWRRGGTGRIIPFWRGAVFALGLLVLALALLSPLDPLGEVLFSAHMGQHLLLILVAPPLLVAGAPELAFLWALPGRWRGWIGRMVGRTNGWIPGGQGGMRAPFAVAVATAWLWAWHLPRLYDWAVRNELAHAAEHAGFLGTALLFWAVVLHVRPRDRAGNGLRMLSVFATAVQGSALGALITFAGRPLYRSHAMISAAWGLTPLTDQQLAGLLMWVPPAVIYLGVGAHLFVGWLDAAGARAELASRRGAGGAAGDEGGERRGGVAPPGLPSR